MINARRVGGWFAAALLVVGGTLGAIGVMSPLLTGAPSAAQGGMVKVLVSGSLIGLGVLSYVAWPSRWNLVGHTHLAFGLVAYVLPFTLLHVSEQAPSPVWLLYAQVTIAGFPIALIGSVVGGYGPRGSMKMSRFVARSIESLTSRGMVASRVRTVALWCLIAMVVSFGVMGFVPALAADPFAAKFFRGAYADSYRPVAPLYRAATSMIAVFLPLIAAYAWARRSIGWLSILFMSFLTMLLTLQRGPALGGVLLFFGVLAAKRAARMPLYFAALVAVYLIGSAVYTLMGLVGIGPFAGRVHATGVLTSIAEGAPDVLDHLEFMSQWMARPEYTYGRTFVGGLVPGNFEWNPSVWTLTVTNPGVAVESIVSGGFRLPAPVWGYVSFGWAGVVAVCFLHGWIVGVLARSARMLIPGAGLEATVALVVVYGVVVDLVSRFYTLSYISLIETAAVVAVLILAPRAGGTDLPARIGKPTAVAGGGLA